MDLLNFIEIETKSGYSDFELYAADITQLGFEVDLIAFSAFKNNYSPVPGTVIGAFYNKGIDIDALSQEPLLDLRNDFGTWISREISGHQVRNLVCLEILGTCFSFQEAIQNLFSVLAVLEIKGFKNKTIAIPLLGTGNQGIEPGQIISTLVNSALDFLQHARYMKKVIFVVKDPHQAEELNEMMNTVLGRNQVRVPRGKVVAGIKNEIVKEIDKITQLQYTGEIFTDLKRIILSDFRSFELGIISRKVLEYIIYDISAESRQFPDLFRKIASLSSLGVAKWIQSYMHVLKEFGNESAHNTLAGNRNPESVGAKDLEVCLFCLQRVLDFYFNYKTGSRQQAQVRIPAGQTRKNPGL